MARLNLSQSHSLPIDVAKQRVTEVFEAYKHEYGIRSRWEGDKLILDGTGFDGEARVGANKVEVDARLGLAVALFKGKIESVIRSELEKRLTA